jgi:hypothetical protein
MIPSLLLLVGLGACSNSPLTNSTSAPAVRSYNGTASVGDFLTITVNSTAKTLSYTNITNGQNETVPYTVNTDGTYSLSDPSGNLISAYEVPGYAMVIQSAKSGPSQNTPALITAVESGPITLSTFQNKSYNYMQMRTNSGGLEVGTVSVGATAIQNSSYWPYGSVSGGSNSPFNVGSFSLNSTVENASGTSFTNNDPNDGSSTIFGTANGFFIVDSGNGSILGLPKATSAAFNSANAGTYTAIYYQKSNATTGVGNVETGTQSFGKASIAITSSGAMTITSPTGTVISQGTLIPVSSASYLYGSAGELTDPCYGLFTYRVTTASSQQDVFVSFVNGAMLFSSFEAPLPWNNNGSTYTYFYGVGLN